MKEQDELSCRHWLLFFRDRNTAEITAYDASKPDECFRSVTAKHPTLDFIEIRGCDSPGSAIEYAKAIRLTSKIITWVNKQVAARESITKQLA